MAEEQDLAKPDLAESLKAVLQANDHGGFTVPAAGLYSHQWLWDSCFTAIGMCHYDVERAQKEILSLLRGQWSNGMLPHIIFTPGDEHRRDRNIWRSWTNPFAPDNVATSGLTQPPMLAEAVVRVGKKLKTPERRTWYQKVYPSLLAYHQWLYTERDPHDEGLTLQIHPWETGMDNAPSWVQELHQHQLATWIRVVADLHLDSFIKFFRRDAHYVPPNQRLSTIDALAFYSTQRRLRRKAYSIDRILTHSLFAIEDVGFNSILVRANHYVRYIAKTIGRALPTELTERMSKTENTLESLWDEVSGQYYSRNFVTHELIKEASIATLLPLYAGSISQERAKQLVKLLHDKKQFGPRYPVPSVPVNSSWFHPLAYWQGPTWINTNWLIIDGLKRYGFDELAVQLTETSLALIKEHGCYEYFSPLTGQPAGAHNFSWTAALGLDLLITSGTVK